MKKSHMLQMLLFAWLALEGCSQPLRQEKAGKVDLVRDPPVAEKVVVQMLPKPVSQGNARVLVTYKNDERLKQALKRGVVTIELEKSKLHLNDSGRDGDEKANDRVFSGITYFDFDEFAAQQKMREQIVKNKNISGVPVFTGRQMVGRQKPVIIFDQKRFSRGVDLAELLGVPAAVNSAKELMITDTKVVEDPSRTYDVCTDLGTPGGKWTFGHLMTEMANQADTSIDPRDFTRAWLAKWEADQTVNGFTIPKRSNILSRVIDFWPRDGDNKLDLTKAPMRLLAIVNRIDLRENLLYGGGSAGEARFVFGVIHRTADFCQPMEFLVIFEYGIKKANCPDLKAWGQKWHDLGAMPQGTAAEIEAFNSALQAITDEFTKAGADASKTPNKSALNQLRTNEIGLAAPWELREFNIRTDGADPEHLDGVIAVGHLSQSTVKQTPATSLNNQDVVSEYVNENSAALVLDKHVVPLRLPTSAQNFLGGSSLNPFVFPNPAVASSPPPDPANFFWFGGTNVAISRNNARHHFSLNTCNACHGGETHTRGFVHIAPRREGNSAALSGFLTGVDVPDPITSVGRHFEDLTRRAQELDNLVNNSCLRGLSDRPLRMVH